MKASDIAFLISLMEESLGNYKGRNELKEELQQIYRDAQSCKYGDRLRVPVIPEIDVMNIDLS